MPPGKPTSTEPKFYGDVFGLIKLLHGNETSGIGMPYPATMQNSRIRGERNEATDAGGQNRSSLSVHSPGDRFTIAFANAGSAPEASKAWPEISTRNSSFHAPSPCVDESIRRMHVPLRRNSRLSTRPHVILLLPLIGDFLLTR